jgi:hypothetical protein
MRTSIGNYLLCVNGSITISFLTTKNTKRDEQREEPEESSLPLTVHSCRFAEKKAGERENA